MSEFLREFMGLMGDHFGNLADEADAKERKEAAPAAAEDNVASPRQEAAPAAREGSRATVAVAPGGRVGPASSARPARCCVVVEGFTGPRKAWPRSLECLAPAPEEVECARPDGRDFQHRSVPAS